MEGHFRQMTDPEKLRLRHLRRNEGHSYGAIANILSDEAEDGRKFDRATIYRAYKNLPDPPDDDPFEWHRLEEYGLPWEASAFLMGMWVYVQAFEAMLHSEYDYPAAIPPTVRQARWWWRVHQLVSEVETKLDIHIWAGEFVRYELFKDILGKPQDMSGLEAYLAYKPWAGPEEHAVYILAVSEGRIPYLPNVWSEIHLGEQLRGIAKHTDAGYAGLDVLHPERLPSETFMEFLANTMKPLVERTRAMERRLQELEQQQAERENAQ